MYCRYGWGVTRSEDKLGKFTYHHVSWESFKQHSMRTSSPVLVVTRVNSLAIAAPALVLLLHFECARQLFVHAQKMN